MLTSSRNSSWKVLVAIAKKKILSLRPSLAGFQVLGYAFGSVHRVNLRAQTQFRVTNEGYSLAAGPRKEQSHVVCISLDFPPTEGI